MRLLRCVVALIAAGVLSAPLAAQNLDADLQRAIQKETTTGDLKAAIAEYQRIFDGARANRALAAQALLQMAQTYRTLRDQRLEATLQRIVREYADQASVAAQASRELAALANTQASRASVGPICVNCVEEQAVRLSPDGRWLSSPDFERHESVIRDLATGAVTRLVADRGIARDLSTNHSTSRPDASVPRAAVFSRDGRQVAFAIGDDGPHQLRVALNQAGSNSRILVDNPEFEYVVPVAWSPDASSILVQISLEDDTWQTAWVSTRDGAVTVLESLEWRRRGFEDLPALSPDGRFVAYSALASNPAKAGAAGPFAPKHIYILAADGSANTQVTTTASVYERPTWTPDGRHLVFSSARSRGPGPFDLWSVPVSDGKPSGAPVVLKSDIGRIGLIGITSAGSLYYTLPRSPVPRVAVAGLRANGGKADAFENQGRFTGAIPSWSPDGMSLASLGSPTSVITRNSGGYADIRISTGQTGEPIIHSLPQGLLARPWAPLWLRDGSAVLVQVLESDGLSFVTARVDVKTGHMLRLGALPRLTTHYVASEDGKTLYCLTTNPSALYAVDLATWRASLVLSDVQAGPNFGPGPDGRLLSVLRNDPSVAALFGWALSPDAAKLAFVKYDGDDDSDSGPGHLAIVGIDGSGLRELYVGRVISAGLTWTSGGVIQFMAIDGAGWKVGRIPAAGGPPSFTDVLTRPTALAVSRDGSRLAYNVVAPPDVELWSLDLSAGASTAR